MSRGTRRAGTVHQAREAGRWPGAGRAAGAHTGPGRGSNVAWEPVRTPGKTSPWKELVFDAGDGIREIRSDANVQYGH